MEIQPAASTILAAGGNYAPIEFEIARKHFQKGFKAFESKNYQQARKSLLRAMHLSSGFNMGRKRLLSFERAEWTLAMVHICQRAPDDAKKMLNHLANRSAGGSPDMYILASAHDSATFSILDGHLETAGQYCMKAINGRRQPQEGYDRKDYYDSLRLMASIFQMLQDDEKSVDYLELIPESFRGEREDSIVEHYFNMQKQSRLAKSSLSEEIVGFQSEGDEVKRALFWAVEFGYEEALSNLLDAGVDVNSIDHKGLPLLAYAVKYEQLSVAGILIQRGACVTAKSRSDSFTALHHAAEQGLEAMVQLLLDSGAQVDLRNGREQTALMLAARSGHESVVRLLLQEGADINATDSEGYTALDIALETDEANPATEYLLLLDAAAETEAKEEHEKSSSPSQKPSMPPAPDVRESASREHPVEYADGPVPAPSVSSPANASKSQSTERKDRDDV